jgi:hypothetical protein
MQVQRSAHREPNRGACLPGDTERPLRRSEVIIARFDPANRLGPGIPARTLTPLLAEAGRTAIGSLPARDEAARSGALLEGTVPPLFPLADGSWPLVTR